MDEFDLIARYLRPLATDPAARGLLDDAALVTPPVGMSLVLTKDMLAADVHFRADDPPTAIAAKALRVNLSDLAAKGAQAYGYMLGLGLSGSEDEAWLRAFADGLAQDQARYRVTLLGGDTIMSPGRLTLSVTALGWVRPGQMIARAGARPGDRVYVSGTLGDAALGLDVLAGRLEPARAADRDFVIRRYHYPEPRLALGAQLVGVASAGADISDGAVADLGHICAASGVGARLILADLPLSEQARRAGLDDDALQRLAATKGDDYELIWTAPPDQSARILAISKHLGVTISAIGDIVAGDRVEIIDAGGQSVDLGAGGYRHRY